MRLPLIVFFTICSLAVSAPVGARPVHPQVEINKEKARQEALRLEQKESQMYYDIELFDEKHSHLMEIYNRFSQRKFRKYYKLLNWEERDYISRKRMKISGLTTDELYDMFSHEITVSYNKLYGTVFPDINRKLKVLRDVKKKILAAIEQEEKEQMEEKEKRYYERRKEERERREKERQREFMYENFPYYKRHIL